MAASAVLANFDGHVKTITYKLIKHIICSLKTEVWGFGLESQFLFY